MSIGSQTESLDRLPLEKSPCIRTEAAGSLMWLTPPYQSPSPQRDSGLQEGPDEMDASTITIKDSTNSCASVPHGKDLGENSMTIGFGNGIPVTPWHPAFKIPDPFVQEDELIFEQSTSTEDTNALLITGADENAMNLTPRRLPYRVKSAPSTPQRHAPNEFPVRKVWEVSLLFPAEDTKRTCLHLHHTQGSILLLAT